MGTPPTAEPPAPRKSSALACGCSLLAALAIILLLGGISLGPIVVGPREARVNAGMQQARQIGQVLFSYAADNTANNNAYPDGKSSTEVFQILIDAGYITDPDLVYVPMQGKVPPEPGQKKTQT